MIKEYLLKIYNQGQVQRLVVRPVDKSDKTPGQRITLTGGGQVQDLVVVRTLS